MYAFFRFGGPCRNRCEREKEVNGRRRPSAEGVFRRSAGQIRRDARQRIESFGRVRQHAFECRGRPSDRQQYPERAGQHGAVASVAARLTASASVIGFSARRRVRSRRQRGTPHARIAATAANESWKLMSPSHAGFHNSMPKAAAARAFRPLYSDVEARADWSIVNITAALTALGGNPAAAT